MGKQFANFIAGDWIESAEATRNVNPSNTGDVVGEYARASATHVAAAIAAAKAAGHGWARSTPQERHDVLRRVADEILARKDELGRLLSREEGKTLAEGIGETIRASQIFAFFAGEALRLAGEKIASVRPGVEVEMTREPMGVVGIITPWNFPIARACPRACSTSSWAAARSSARRSSTAGTCRRSPSPVPPPRGAMSPPPARAGWRSSSWRWAARTRWSCSTTRI
jgi:acyl-CoA reductase-like NAD-dependent aldehyde dehydrogenase